MQFGDSNSVNHRIVVDPPEGQLIWMIQSNPPQTYRRERPGASGEARPQGDADGALNPRSAPRAASIPCATIFSFHASVST
ncbi:MAG: hypothetical protein JO090_03245 [Rhizobacter sp.]|nr:hypothetical protein [Rhizobacter sp.]